MKEGIAVVFGVIVLYLLIAVALTYPFMWAWNYGMTAAFPMVGTLEPLQAFSVLVVSMFLKPSTTVNSNK